MCSSQQPMNGADSAPVPEPRVPAGALLSCDLCSRYTADMGVFMSGGVILRRCGRCATLALEREAVGA